MTTFQSRDNRQFEPGRAVEIISPQYGSGYQIGGRLVLTAAHLLPISVGSSCQVRSKPNFGQIEATLVWKAEGWDIALIELPESVPLCEPVVLGQLPEAKAGEKLEFQMYGYPLWGRTQRDEGKSAAGGRQIEGIIYLADRSPDGLLVLEAHRLPPEATTERSQWEGASGAAIVCDGLVIGVQSRHQNPKRPASLEAAPLLQVSDDPQWCDLLRRHGIDPELEIAAFPKKQGGGDTFHFENAGATIGTQIGKAEAGSRITSVIHYHLSRDDTGASSRTKPSQLTRQEYQNRQALLTKVNHFWVKGVLEKSLHEQVLIALGMEERPDAVEYPWTVLVETNAQLPRELAADATILSLFDQMGAGRTLLILGEPGSGKTNTLLQLARDLISRAQHDTDHLIPVVFNLSSWTPTRKQGRKTLPQSISDWLIEELNTKYQVPKAIATNWVQQQQLLLLLDGLDEVKVDERHACMEAINAFQHEAGTEMVVCCRVKDYRALSARLRCQTAIYLRPLSLLQIQSYLRRLSTDLTGLAHLLTIDHALQELAQSPLMLNIMVVVYQGIPISDLPQMQVIKERRSQLFNAYIQRMLSHRGIPLGYSSARFLSWLNWLAQRMRQEAQTVFLIETMQPEWLKPENRKWYWTGSALMGGLIGGLVVGLSVGLISGLNDGLLGGLTAGLSWGLIGGLTNKIHPVEKLQWFWQKSNLWLSFGLIGGLLGGLLGGLNVGLMGGLSFGLSFGLMGGLTSAKIESTTMPNQGIWNSAKNFVRCWLIGWLSFGLSFGLIFGLSFGLSFGLMCGPLGGIGFGLAKGGQACIQHFILRFILYFNGRIPWHYAKFLDRAADRLFLQKVGGGYIFIHRLLLEHFANLDPNTIQQLSK